MTGPSALEFKYSAANSPDKVMKPATFNLARGKVRVGGLYGMSRAAGVGEREILAKQASLKPS